MRLWIDDERVVPSGFTHSAQSSAQALNVLERAKAEGVEVECISFDHDLGYTWDDGSSRIDGGVRDDDSRRVMDWLVENNYWPREIRVHSMNPVGKAALLATARRYAPVGTLIVSTLP